MSPPGEEAGLCSYLGELVDLVGVDLKDRPEA